jgi:hypothetical protein
MDILELSNSLQRGVGLSRFWLRMIISRAHKNILMVDICWIFIYLFIFMTDITLISGAALKFILMPIYYIKYWCCDL